MLSDQKKITEATGPESSSCFSFCRWGQNTENLGIGIRVRTRLVGATYSSMYSVGTTEKKIRKPSQHIMIPNHFLCFSPILCQTLRSGADRCSRQWAISHGPWAPSKHMTYDRVNERHRDLGTDPHTDAPHHQFWFEANLVQSLGVGSRIFFDNPQPRPLTLQHSKAYLWRT